MDVRKCSTYYVPALCGIEYFWVIMCKSFILDPSEKIKMVVLMRKLKVTLKAYFICHLRIERHLIRHRSG